MTAENQSKLQHTFDVMAAHLLTQGEPSMATMDDGGDLKCAYRGDNGKRCIVGFCIKDEKYTSYIEGMGAGCPLVTDLLDDVYCKDADFLWHMQRIHDKQEPATWAAHLKAVGESYQLDISVVDTFTNPVIPQPEVLVYAE